MKINVYIEREDKDIMVEVNSIDELFKKLKINPGTVLIVRNNTLITNKTKLKNNNRIRLLSVVSGG